MISDTLAQALNEIRFYQKEDSGVYDALTPAINVVCEVMYAMCQYLDTPPAPVLHDALQDLQAAIRQLDLSAVRVARQNLFETWRTVGGNLDECVCDEVGHIEIAIHLFGLPDFELEDYELTGQGIGGYAADKSGWLAMVGDAVDKLIADGWAVKFVKSNVEARHPEVRTCKEAVDRLGRLHIDEAIMQDIDIAEWSADGERLSPV